MSIMSYVKKRLREIRYDQVKAFIGRNAWELTLGTEEVIHRNVIFTVLKEIDIAELHKTFRFLFARQAD